MTEPVMDIAFLNERARSVRRDLLEMILRSGKGHIGGGLSCVEILVALYQGRFLRFDPGNPDWSDRDRLIFSKGHASEVLYAVLADVEFFPKSELLTYGVPGSRLGSHPDNAVPGVEVSTGSLGHGIGIAAGMALAARRRRQKHCTVAILGDGECYEGSVWEAAMFAGQHALSRLIVIVDRNRQITLDRTEDCNRLEPFDEKWRAFGWDVTVINGHSFPAIAKALAAIHSRDAGRPLAIIADTKKGRGISFMEDQPRWHHNVPKGAQAEQARKELA